MNNVILSIPVPGVGVVGLMGQERRMRREMEEFNDLVFLPVTEGYRMNSRKVGWQKSGLVGLVWWAFKRKYDKSF